MVKKYSILTVCGEWSWYDTVYIDCLFCSLAQEDCQSKERIRDA